jgi:putative ABC transport system substrate-binding protein
MRRYRVALFVIAYLLAVSAVAQPRVVGVLALGHPEVAAVAWDRVFAGRLRELGYSGDRSLAFEYRWARGDLTRYPQLARELMERRPAVIMTQCGPSLKAIRDISRSVPVIANCADESNFYDEVASLARPGGRTTGMTFFSPESVGKRIELLREVVPGMTRLAVLHEPNDPIPGNFRELERLQPLLGLTLLRLAVAKAAELEGTFETAARERAHGMFIFPTNLLVAERIRIGDLARKHRIATVSEFSPNVEAGGLLSYGGNVNEWLGKTAPMYVDRILKGAKPGDLPIVQPTQFELVVNLATARAIGVKIPHSVLARADRVIE